MLLIFQIALGVAGGLWLFRWWLQPRETKPPLFTVRNGIAVCVFVLPTLYVLHLLLWAARGFTR